MSLSMQTQTHTESHSVCTQGGVFRAFLCDHDWLVLLAVELQQTLLVTEMLHLCSPHHRLCQVPLHLTAVTPRSLVTTKKSIYEGSKKSAHI